MGRVVTGVPVAAGLPAAVVSNRRAVEIVMSHYEGNRSSSRRNSNSAGSPRGSRSDGSSGGSRRALVIVGTVIAFSLGLVKVCSFCI